MQFIKDEFGLDVPPDALLQKPYKLCDFRITYPELFRDISDRYGVTEDDFVGWGDCDIIYGRFSDFLDMDDDYHDHRRFSWTPDGGPQHLSVEETVQGGGEAARTSGRRESSHC